MIEFLIDAFSVIGIFSFIGWLGLFNVKAKKKGDEVFHWKDE